MRETDLMRLMRFNHAAANTEEVPFVNDQKIYTMRDKEQLLDAARSDLARKVLDTVEAQRFIDIDHCCDKTITEVVVPALERLFQVESVAVTTKGQAGGEGRST